MEEDLGEIFGTERSEPPAHPLPQELPHLDGPHLGPLGLVGRVVILVALLGGEPFCIVKGLVRRFPLLVEEDRKGVEHPAVTL